MTALLSMPPQFQRTGEVLCGSAIAAMKNVWRQTVAYVEIAISLPAPPPALAQQTPPQTCCQDSGGRSPGGPPCQVIERWGCTQVRQQGVASSRQTVLDTVRKLCKRQGAGRQSRFKRPLRGHCENGIR